MFSFGLVCVDQISACMFVSESEREDIASCYGTVQKKQTKKKYIQFPQAPSSRLNE